MAAVRAVRFPRARGVCVHRVWRVDACRVGVCRCVVPLARSRRRSWTSSVVDVAGAGRAAMDKGALARARG